jgi:hypothetical protein
MVYVCDNILENGINLEVDIVHGIRLCDLIGDEVQMCMN